MEKGFFSFWSRLAAGRRLRANGQGGFIHALLLVFVMLGLSVWGISELFQRALEQKQDIAGRSNVELKGVKGAMLDYALIPPDVTDALALPGRYNAYGATLQIPFRRFALPCPDVAGDDEVLDGVSDTMQASCLGGGLQFLQSASRAGRLPWRDFTGASGGDFEFVRGIGGSDFRDAYDQRFWYVMSDNLAHDPNTPLNPHHLLRLSAGWLAVADETSVTVANRVAAIALAPGQYGGDNSGARPPESVLYPGGGAPAGTLAAAAIANLHQAYLEPGAYGNLAAGVVSVNFSSGDAAADKAEYLTIDELAGYDGLGANLLESPGAQNIYMAVGGETNGYMGVGALLQAHLQRFGYLPEPAMFSGDNVNARSRPSGIAGPQSTIQVKTRRAIIAGATGSHTLTGSASYLITSALNPNQTFVIQVPLVGTVSVTSAAYSDSYATIVGKGGAEIINRKADGTPADDFAESAPLAGDRPLSLYVRLEDLPPVYLLGGAGLDLGTDRGGALSPPYNIGLAEMQTDLNSPSPEVENYLRTEDGGRSPSNRHYPADSLFGLPDGQYFGAAVPRVGAIASPFPLTINVNNLVAVSGRINVPLRVQVRSADGRIPVALAAPGAAYFRSSMAQLSNAVSFSSIDDADSAAAMSGLPPYFSRAVLPAGTYLTLNASVINVEVPANYQVIGSYNPSSRSWQLEETPLAPVRIRPLNDSDSTLAVKIPGLPNGWPVEVGDMGFLPIESAPVSAVARGGVLRFGGKPAVSELPVKIHLRSAAAITLTPFPPPGRPDAALFTTGFGPPVSQTVSRGVVGGFDFYDNLPFGNSVSVTIVAPGVLNSLTHWPDRVQRAGAAPLPSPVVLPANTRFALPAGSRIIYPSGSAITIGDAFVAPSNAVAQIPPGAVLTTRLPANGVFPGGKEAGNSLAEVRVITLFFGGMAILRGARPSFDDSHAALPPAQRLFDIELRDQAVYTPTGGGAPVPLAGGRVINPFNGRYFSPSVVMTLPAGAILSAPARVPAKLYTSPRRVLFPDTPTANMQRFVHSHRLGEAFLALPPNTRVIRDFDVDLRLNEGSEFLLPDDFIHTVQRVNLAGARGSENLTDEFILPRETGIFDTKIATQLQKLREAGDAARYIRSNTDPYINRFLITDTRSVTVGYGNLQTSLVNVALNYEITTGVTDFPARRVDPAAVLLAKPLTLTMARVINAGSAVRGILKNRLVMEPDVDMYASFGGGVHVIPAGSKVDLLAGVAHLPGGFQRLERVASDAQVRSGKPMRLYFDSGFTLRAPGNALTGPTVFGRRLVLQTPAAFQTLTARYLSHPHMALSYLSYSSGSPVSGILSVAVGGSLRAPAGAQILIPAGNNLDFLSPVAETVSASAETSDYSMLPEPAVMVLPPGANVAAGSIVINGPAYLALGYAGFGMAISRHASHLSGDVVVFLEGEGHVVDETPIDSLQENFYAPIAAGSRLDINGFAELRADSGFYPDLMPQDDSELLRDFPIAYAVAPECREDASPGVHCAEGPDEGLVVSLQQGEYYRLQEPVVPKGGILLASSIEGLQLSVVRQRIGENFSTGAGFNTDALHIAKDTGRVESIGGGSYDSGANNERLVVRVHGNAAGGNLRAYMLGAASHTSPLGSLHYAAVTGALTIYTGGHTGENTDQALGSVALSPGDAINLGVGALIIAGEAGGDALFGKDSSATLNFAHSSPYSNEVNLQDYALASGGDAARYQLTVSLAADAAQVGLLGDLYHRFDAGANVDVIGLGGTPNSLSLAARENKLNLITVNDDSLLHMSPGYLWQAYMPAGRRTLVARPNTRWGVGDTYYHPNINAVRSTLYPGASVLYAGAGIDYIIVSGMTIGHHADEFSAELYADQEWPQPWLAVRLQATVESLNTWGTGLELPEALDAYAMLNYPLDGKNPHRLIENNLAVISIVNFNKNLDFSRYAGLDPPDVGSRVRTPGSPYILGGHSAAAAAGYRNYSAGFMASVAPASIRARVRNLQSGASEVVTAVWRITNYSAAGGATNYIRYNRKNNPLPGDVGGAFRSWEDRYGEQDRLRTVSPNIITIHANEVVTHQYPWTRPARSFTRTVNITVVRRVSMTASTGLNNIVYHIRATATNVALADTIDDTRGVRTLAIPVPIRDDRDVWAGRLVTSADPTQQRDRGEIIGISPAASLSLSVSSLAARMDMPHYQMVATRKSPDFAAWHFPYHGKVIVVTAVAGLGRRTSLTLAVGNWGNAFGPVRWNPSQARRFPASLMRRLGRPESPLGSGLVPQLPPIPAEYVGEHTTPFALHQSQMERGMHTPDLSPPRIRRQMPFELWHIALMNDYDVNDFVAGVRGGVRYTYDSSARKHPMQSILNLRRFFGPPSNFNIFPVQDAWQAQEYTRTSRYSNDSAFYGRYPAGPQTAVVASDMVLYMDRAFNTKSGGFGYPHGRPIPAQTLHFSADFTFGGPAALVQPFGAHHLRAVADVYSERSRLMGRFLKYADLNYPGAPRGLSSLYDDVTAACTNVARIQGFSNCPELYESMAWQPMLNGIITYEGAEVTIASGVSLFTGVSVVIAPSVAISVSVFYVTVVPAMTNTVASILVSMQTLTAGQSIAADIVVNTGETLTAGTSLTTNYTVDIFEPVSVAMQTIAAGQIIATDTKVSPSLTLRAGTTATMSYTVDIWGPISTGITVLTLSVVANGTINSFTATFNVGPATNFIDTAISVATMTNYGTGTITVVQYDVNLSATVSMQTVTLGQSITADITVSPGVILASGTTATANYTLATQTVTLGQSITADITVSPSVILASGTTATANYTLDILGSVSTPTATTYPPTITSTMAVTTSSTVTTFLQYLPAITAVGGGTIIFGTATLTITSVNSVSITRPLDGDVRLIFPEPRGLITVTSIFGGTRVVTIYPGSIIYPRHKLIVPARALPPGDYDLYTHGKAEAAVDVGPAIRPQRILRWRFDSVVDRHSFNLAPAPCEENGVVVEDCVVEPLGFVNHDVFDFNANRYQGGYDGVSLTMAYTGGGEFFTVGFDTTHSRGILLSDRGAEMFAAYYNGDSLSEKGFISPYTSDPAAIDANLAHNRAGFLRNTDANFVNPGAYHWTKNPFGTLFAGNTSSISPMYYPFLIPVGSDPVGDYFPKQNVANYPNQVINTEEGPSDLVGAYLLTEDDDLMQLRLAHKIVIPENSVMRVFGNTGKIPYPNRVDKMFQFPPGSYAEVLNVDGGTYPAAHPYIARFAQGLEIYHGSNVVSVNSPYNSGWRRIDVGNKRVLHYHRTRSLPFMDPLSNTEVFTNVWIRLPSGGALINRQTGESFTLPANSLVNPILGSYLALSDPNQVVGNLGRMENNYLAEAGVARTVHIVRPALTIPPGALLHVGQAGAALKNVKAVAIFSLGPLESVDCPVGVVDIISGQYNGPGSPVVAINQLREGLDQNNYAGSPPVRGAIGMSHPCLWLDDPENMDGDRLFLYRSRRRYADENIRARIVSNDRTFVLGGKLEIN